MEWVFVPAAGVLFVTCAASLIAAGLVWRRRTGLGGPLLPLLMIAAGGYALVSGLEVGAVAVPWKLVWAKLQYIGSGSVSTLLLLFAARYTGQDRWLRKWRRWAIWIPPALNVTAVMTNEFHHRIWAGFERGPAGSNLLVYLHGPGFYFAVLILYVYIFAAGALLIRAAIRPGVVRRRQVATVLLATLFPFAASILYSLDITFLRGLDLVPISIFFSAVILIASTGTLRLFDVVPVARDVLIERMSDAVIVLDGQQRVIDLNPSAERLFHLDSSSVGAPLGSILPIWPQLRARIESGRETHVEVALESDPIRHVDVRVSPLSSRRKHVPGCVVVFRDISEKHGIEISLQEANRRLADQLERIEGLQRDLREQAIRDALTGLFNRRYLAEILPRELKRASCGDRPLCAVLFDIDRFKERNDRYGHEEGDRLLAQLGALLLERTRPGDVACRYGGEEFLLVLPGATLSVARVRAEEIRRAFEALSKRSTYGSAVTLSAGIAAYPSHGTTQDALIRAADEALYIAKERGRDRTCIAGEEPFSLD